MQDIKSHIARFLDGLFVIGACCGDKSLDMFGFYMNFYYSYNHFKRLSVTGLIAPDETIDIFDLSLAPFFRNFKGSSLTLRETRIILS